MKISVIGSGYVGLVTGACLAALGTDVLCMDVDPEKVARLQAGDIPIYEPGLDEIVRRCSAEGRLRFTTDASESATFGQVQFIAVGTPPGEDGSADLSYVLAAARAIGRHMMGYTVVVDKSTVPVGTAEKVRAEIAQSLSIGVLHAYSAVASPPEGTILTVAREVAAAAMKESEGASELRPFLESIAATARLSVEKTPTLLAVLREAGVVDSGGAGLQLILEGIANVPSVAPSRGAVDAERQSSSSPSTRPSAGSSKTRALSSSAPAHPVACSRCPCCRFSCPLP
jgi:UDPglucose 6-dehydrogenase